jgi:predicted nucleic acid-binding protein
MADVSVEELVFGYASLAKTVRPSVIEPVVKNDPDDDKVLACARSANVDAILSGDIHLLSLREYAGIAIITVNQFLERL